MFKLSSNRIQLRARIDFGLEPSANKQTTCHSNRRGSAKIHSALDSGTCLDSRNGSRAVSARMLHVPQRFRGTNARVDSIHDDGTDRLARMHEVESGINVIER